MTPNTETDDAPTDDTTDDDSVASEAAEAVAEDLEPDGGDDPAECRCGVTVVETPTDDARTDGGGDGLPSGDAMAGMLLEDAAGVVTSSRDTHGDAVENQQHIAQGWTWYLRGRGLLDEDEAITGGDVGRMMPLVKMSRTAVGTYDVDHDRDVAGYAGIAAACEVADGRAELDDLTGEADRRGGDDRDD